MRWVCIVVFGVIMLWASESRAQARESTAFRVSLVPGAGFLPDSTNTLTQHSVTQCAAQIYRPKPVVESISHVGEIENSTRYSAR